MISSKHQWHFYFSYFPIHILLQSSCLRAVFVLLLGLWTFNCRSNATVKHVSSESANETSAIISPQTLALDSPEVSPPSVPSDNFSDTQNKDNASTGWVDWTSSLQTPLAFSSNGKWFASLVDRGILLFDSRNGQPLAFSPFFYDKAIGLAFDPSSRFITAIADFTILVFAVDLESRDGKDEVSLKREPDMISTGDTGLHPPVFDRTGQYLAIAENNGAVLYDFYQRKPIVRINPNFTSPSWAMGFSGDILYFVEPATPPCNCDDYKGGKASIAAYRINSRVVRRIKVHGELTYPFHFRQAKIAASSGLWDARNGQRLAQYNLNKNERVINIARLREQKSSVGVIASNENDNSELAVLNDDGTVKKLGSLPEFPLFIGVRPQDDELVFFSADHGGIIYFIDLINGRQRRETVNPKLCIENNHIVSESICLKNNNNLEIPAIEDSPVADEIRFVTAKESSNTQGSCREGILDYSR